MNIKYLLDSSQLRLRQIDKERIKSLLKSSETNVGVVKTIKLTDDSATVIFREIYESVRQLGDAKWWLLGYEPLNHEISMEMLKTINIKEKLKLNHLSRFKKIRNDANYRGFRVSVAQAQEITDFWNACGKDIINLIEKEIK